MAGKKFSVLLVCLLAFSLLSVGALAADVTFVFSDAPSQVEVAVGSSVLKDVKITNVASPESVVELTIETNAPVSVGVVPGSVKLDKGDSATLSLSFLSSPTNVVNKYPATLRVRGDGIDVSKDFDLIVLPTAEKKFEINNDYLSTLNKFESLNKRFDQVKDSGCVLVGAGDVSSVTPKEIVGNLADLNDVLEKTRIAIKENDFVTANVEVEKSKVLVSGVESKINDLRSAQDACEKEKARASGYATGGLAATTMGIIIVVVLVGLLAYRHYTRLPKIRKLLPSSDVSVKIKSEEPAKPDAYHGMNKLGQRKTFQYEFKKKKD